MASSSSDTSPVPAAAQFAVYDSNADDCVAMQNILSLVGRRWTGAVLLACTRGARRFSEYRRLVVGISDRLLSQRLRELESLGLLEREVIPTTPVQILYRPSVRGEELIGALQPLLGWGSRHLPHADSSPRPIG